MFFLEVLLDNAGLALAAPKIAAHVCGQFALVPCAPPARPPVLFRSPIRLAMARFPTYNRVDNTPCPE